MLAMLRSPRMTVDLELASEARQLITGICLDCDRTQNLTKTGTCSVCGSNSIIKRGAIRELRRLLRLRRRSNTPPAPTT